MSVHHLIDTFALAADCSHHDPDYDPPVFNLATGEAPDWAAYAAEKKTFDAHHQDSPAGFLCLDMPCVSCLECGGDEGYDVCQLDSADPNYAARRELVTA
ncbi:hypothetical protein F1C58_16120 (plasmid) [Glaciihabitans sp. INWT7]|uniref:hypothetical protein n=1 Tax=Glaciihabitans sp. INWT7 TaxID=2596912 RepID=UPI001623DF27|nr:hypothetical protein [Glaciihabitans sp. INWT7]QNE48587.1 hypothetical protein F1C58_16120 [Glaciihabitans sp. INWT7]